MKRIVYAIIMILVIPIAVGFAVVLIYSALGIERDFSQLYDRASSYSVGMIAGWYLWGGAR